MLNLFRYPKDIGWPFSFLWREKSKRDVYGSYSAAKPQLKCTKCNNSWTFGSLKSTKNLRWKFSKFYTHYSTYIQYKTNCIRYWYVWVGSLDTQRSMICFIILNIRTRNRRGKVKRSLSSCRNRRILIGP